MFSSTYTYAVNAHTMPNINNEAMNLLKNIHYEQNMRKVKMHLLQSSNSKQNKNRDDKIRTCDPRDPNTVRYQAALHPDLSIKFSISSAPTVLPLLGCDI